MLSRILGRKEKRQGEQLALAGAMYQLDRRRRELYIPFLQQRIAALKARVAQKAGG